MSFLAGIGSILGGLGGLFGAVKKPEQPDVKKNILDQAAGAREAAAQYGFNPLTMLQYGNPAGAGFNAGGGGVPPLASIEAITGGFQEIMDERNGTAERQRKADQLNLDLAQVKLDQARAELKSLQSPLGRQAVMVPNGGAVFRDRVSMGNRTGAAASVASGSAGRSVPLAPDREVDRLEVTDSPGVFVIDNAVTGGPIVIPGDGDPWGLDEFGTAAAVGAPQILRNHVKNSRDEIRDPEKRAQARKKAARDLVNYPPNTFGLFHRVYDYFSN